MKPNAHTAWRRLCRPLLAALALSACAPAADAGKDADHAAIFAEIQEKGHAAVWQRHPFIGIPLAAEAPTVDGVVGVREWGCAAAVSYVLHMQEATMVRDRVRWLLCYTATDLHLAFRFERPHAARRPGPKDFFELLLDANHDHKRYCNLAGNLEGKMWDGLAPNLDRKAWTPNWQYQARLTETGWEGELSIPFKDFPGCDAPPAPGTVWGADFVRNERTPTDRLAQWAWRSRWHAVKDLAHIMFTGQPLAVGIDAVGWLPDVRKMGVKLAVSNFSDSPVELAASLELRRAGDKLLLPYLKALDSAFTEDLDAAIGAQVVDEVKRTLEPYAVVKQDSSVVRVPANTSKQVALTAPDEPGSYLTAFTLREHDALLAGMVVPFVVKVPLAIELRSFLYSAAMLAYAVDLRRVKDEVSETATLTVEARIGDRVLARESRGALHGKDEASGELRFEPVPEATVKIAATIRDGERIVAANETPLMIPPKAPWIGNSVGRSKFIPPPFVPLEATQNHCRTLTIRYDWPKGALFPDVRVKGKPILAAPLALAFKDAAGVDVPVSVTAFELRTSDIEQATYAFEATAGPLGRLSGTATVEFDGFLWYDVTLTPAGTVDLSGCRFTAALKNEYARIYTRGRLAKGMGDPIPKGPDSAAIPPAGLTFPFTFQTWIGYVEGGLQWYCENARNWRNSAPKEAMRIEPGPELTSLTVSFIDAQTTIKGPIDWHFGLQPTPARVKLGGAEDHAYFQLGGIPDPRGPDPALKESNPKRYHKAVQHHKLIAGGLAERGVKAVILFSSYNDMFGYPGMRDPDRKERLHRFVKCMHDQGVKVLVYNGWGISTKCDEWEQYGSELVNLPLKNSGYSTYWLSPVSLFPDLFLWRVAEHMREFDLDGIYMDSTTGVNFSTHPNGMRWTDEKGKVRGSYPVRAMRDFTKRIYKALNGEVLKGGIFYNHHSPPANVCVENFVNVRCPSEFAQFYEGALDEGFVDYFMAKNGGVQFGFHTELTNKNWMRSIRKSINELNAIAVPLGVSFKTVNFAPWAKYDYSRMGQPMHKIWQAMAWLGSATAEHLPWWRNAAYVSTDPADGVLTAVWLRKGDKALLSVSNLAAGKRTIAVTLNLPAMGFDAVTVEDAVTGAPVRINGAVVPQEIEEQRWRLLKLSP